MADNTTKIERDDVAAIAAELAKILWFEKKNQNPKASDADFLALVAVCAMALKGGNPSNISEWINSLFKR